MTPCPPVPPGLFVSGRTAPKAVMPCATHQFFPVISTGNGIHSRHHELDMNHLPGRAWLKGLRPTGT